MPPVEGDVGVTAQNPSVSGERSPVTSLVQQPANPVGTSVPSNALTTTQGITNVQDAASSSQNVVSSNAVDQPSRYNPNNEYANNYGSLGMGYGGLGMGYGGLGMGGMYGGVGMPGMYGMGMSEDFQRSQMTFMLVGRLLEMCGMFAGVIQMTFGSALQFMGNYIGMSQQYNKLKSGMYMDEAGRWVELPKGSPPCRGNTATGSSRRPSRRRNQESQGHPLFAAFRRLLFLLLAVLITRRMIR